MLPLRKAPVGPCLILVLILATMMACPAAMARQTRPCTASDADKPAIAAAVRNLFAAAEKDDVAAFDALLAPGYFMYDGGRRFDGDAILTKLLMEKQKQGYTWVWSVQDPQIEVDCTTAWIAYVNEGSLTAPDGKKQDLTWLESAFLEKRNGHWLLRFAQSMRAQ